MKISSINTRPYSISKSMVKNNVSSRAFEQSNYKLQNKKCSSPSFGFDPMGLIALGMLMMPYVGAVYQTNRQDKQRMEEENRIREQREADINNTASKLNITRKEAEIYLDTYLRYASLEETKDGNEKGLNAVMGYGIEKYKLATELIAPVVAKNYGNYPHFNVPNGAVLYGPAGGGKTYIASKVTEHFNELGIRTVNINLEHGEYKHNAKIIRDTFKEAQEYHERTNKYTVINFVQDFDNIFIDRNIKPEAMEQVGAFLNCAEDCSDKGIMWIATANNPKLVDKAVLRPGRADFKLPIGEMKNFAISDMIKYSLFKYDEKESSIDFDYQKVIDEMKKNKRKYTPAEFELFVKKAKANKPLTQEYLTADMVIEVMNDYNQNDFPTLDRLTRKKFREDREYIDSLSEEDKN